MKNKFYIIGIVAILVITLIYSIGLYVNNNSQANIITSQSKTIMSLSSGNTDLNNRLEQCYSVIRGGSRVPRCGSTQDCIKNPDLAGCYMNDCNWCCFGLCNLMGCMHEE